MPQRKKILTLLVMFILVVGGVAAVHSPQGRNLQVLPADISDQKLDSIMNSFTVALGVDCKFCHKAIKDYPDSLNFASDEEPMKENARTMMRMAILINKTYFYFDKNQKPEYLSAVHCKTCHRGEPFPPEK
jgi:hypothetical protein